jgi:hypothetical protein
VVRWRRVGLRELCMIYDGICPLGVGAVYIRYMCHNFVFLDGFARVMTLMDSFLIQAALTGK